MVQAFVLYIIAFSFPLLLFWPLHCLSLSECWLYGLNLRETNTNIETLLIGNDEISINENYNIFNKVRAYIRQTKIF